MAAEKEDKKWPAAGFAKWRITHAAYEGDDMFVAHLRSGKSKRFVLRVNVESDEYDDLEAALQFDGEAANLVGEMIAMSTNRKGQKQFQRAAPLPWYSALVLAGETDDSGQANVQVRLEDGVECNMSLSVRQAASLAAACGGEAEAVGKVLNYRLLPDDDIEWRMVA